MTEQPNNKSTGEDNKIAIHRIFLKDVSFETPNSPEIFTEKWNPHLEVDIETARNQLQEDIFEVVLTVTATAKQGDKTCFLAEVKQAGIFTIKGLEQKAQDSMLGVFCPNTLYPYARQVISDLVTHGGFPQLLLAPISFKKMYADSMNHELTKAAAETGTP